MSKVLGGLFVAAILLTGTVRADDKLENPTKGKCPVSKHDIKDGVTGEVGGKKYGFCCEKCVTAFKKDPEKYLKKSDKKDSK